MATISTLNRGGTTAGVTAVTTTVNHGITTGQVVRVYGTGADGSFGGYWTATSTGATTLTYDQRSTITSIVRASNVVTVTFTPTTVAYGQYTVGDLITIAGISTAGFDGNFTVASVPARNQVTYAQTAADATGTLGASPFIFHQTATTTGGNIVPVIRLEPSSLVSNSGMTVFGGSAETVAMTDELDTTYIQAQDTLTRSIKFNLTDIPSSGTGSVQTNQDIVGVSGRVRGVSTASSSLLIGYTNGGVAALLTCGGLYDTAALTGLPAGHPTDSYGSGPAYASRGSNPFTITSVNAGTLTLIDYATTSAARALIYEVGLDVYLWAKPYLSAGSVSASAAGTTRPRFTWTHAHADGQPQFGYEIAVYTAATATPGATNTTNRVWYSFPTITSVSTAVCGVDLSVGPTYYAYIRTFVYSGYDFYYGEWGSGTASSFPTPFTLSVQSPISPLITTSSWDVATQSVSLTASGYGNMLSADNSSFETTAGGWVANSGSPTVARTTAQSFIGAASLGITSSGSGGTVNARSGTGTAGLAVDPAVTYKIVGMSRAATAGRTIRIGLLWTAASGTFLGVSWGPTTTNTTSGWTSVIASVRFNTDFPSAASFAAFANVVFEIQGTGATELHYLDQVSVSPNSTGTTTTTNLVLIPSAETGVTAGISTAGASGTPSTGPNVLSQATDVAYVGTSSYAVSIQNATDGNCFALQATTGYATPTTAAHTVSAWFYVPTGSALAGSVVTLAGEGGTGANYTNGTSVPATLVAGQWVRASRVITWSSTAGLPALVARISPITTGSTLYSDGWMLHTGSSPVAYFDGSTGNARWNGTAHGSTSILAQPYDVGGITSRTLTTERSEDFGQTWAAVRNMAGVATTDALQVDTDRDYEAPRGATVLYRTKVDAVDSSGNAVASVYSPPVSVATVNPGTWALKDPLVPANNYIGVRVQAASVQSTQEEQTGIFRVYGRSKAVVTAGALTGADGSIEVFASAAEWVTLEALINVQRTLLLQDPANGQRYIRITSRSWVNEWLGGAQIYRVSLGFVEVEAP